MVGEADTGEAETCAQPSSTSSLLARCFEIHGSDCVQVYSPSTIAIDYQHHGRRSGPEAAPADQISYRVQPESRHEKGQCRSHEKVRSTTTRTVLCAIECLNVNVLLQVDRRQNFGSPGLRGRCGDRALFQLTRGFALRASFLQGYLFIGADQLIAGHQSTSDISHWIP